MAAVVRTVPAGVYDAVHGAVTLGSE